MSFKHAWDPKSKQTPEQIEKRLTAERDASRQLARQLEWRLLALERTLTAEQRTQLGTFALARAASFDHSPASMTGWQHLESSRNVAIYIKNDVNSNTYGMRAVYVAAVGEEEQKTRDDLISHFCLTSCCGQRRSTFCPSSPTSRRLASGTGRSRRPTCWSATTPPTTASCTAATSTRRASDSPLATMCTVCRGTWGAGGWVSRKKFTVVAQGPVQRRDQRAPAVVRARQGAGGRGRV